MKIPKEFSGLCSDRSIRNIIREKIAGFKSLYNNASAEDVFFELVFCLLTPQSRFDVCAEVVEELKKHRADFFGNNADEILTKLFQRVRFKNNKKNYVLCAREFFQGQDIRKLLKKLATTKEKRNWLFQNVKGLGLKESSHFLRNIGIGLDIAILDRHVLRCLCEFGVICEVPKTLTPKKYDKIENLLLQFADDINITAEELDFLMFLWGRMRGSENKKDLELLKKMK